MGKRRSEEGIKLKRAFFISFEGIDGCGKSTQIEGLKPWLSAEGLDPLFPREPGGTEIGEEIRRLLLDKKKLGMTAETELLLFLAARAQICRELIAPALAAGRPVICDRFLDSSLAYQGYGRGLGAEAVEQLNRFAAAEIRPDRTYLLDLPVKLAQERLNSRQMEKNRLDLESLEFMEKTRQGFLSLADRERQRIVLLDARRSPEEIQAQIREDLRRFLK